MTPVESAKKTTLVVRFPILEDNNPLTVLRHFFRLRLSQYGLLGKHEPDDILHEAISRLWSASLAGKDIYNAVAWLRQTGLNIINELSRAKNKYRIIDNPNLDLELILSDEQKHHESEDYELYVQLYQALQELDFADRELIILRFYKQMSWQDIGELLAKNGVPLSNAALRKRGSRALENLRKIFMVRLLEQ